MQTEFFESDPFAPRKADLLLSIDTDYRFEKGDEVTIEAKDRWYGIDMMCASHPHGGCYWIPAVDLEGGAE